jgi:hemoglobin-like flavoprotein
MTEPTNPLVDSLTAAALAAHAAARGRDRDLSPADVFARWVYGDLFEQHPETRVMFPRAMTEQRDRFVRALTAACTHAYDPETGQVCLTDSEREHLERLGVDHLKYGAVDGHYPAVVDSLLFILRIFLGDQWADVADLWEAAAFAVAGGMVDGAAKWLADGNPPWVDAVIHKIEETGVGAVAVDLRGLSHPYRVPVGQRVSMCLQAEPGDWLSAVVRRTDGPRLTVIEGAAAGDLVRLEPPYPIPTFAVEDSPS